MDDLGKTAELVLDFNGAVFHTITWVVAYFAGIARQVRDDDTWNAWDVLRRGCFSGFLGFATIALIRGVWSGPAGDLWYFIGLAALVGLLGKEQERFLLFLLNSVFNKMGLKPDERSHTTKPLGHRPDTGRDRLGDGDEK